MSSQVLKSIHCNIGTGLLLLSCCCATARADVVISSKPTVNMSCGYGFCEPTAVNAVLNAGDLQNDIAEFGNMTVQTTGKGVEARNIVVKEGFSSPAATTLNLFAHDAIVVDASVVIGSGGQASDLELESGKGGTLGTLSFGPKGNINFATTSSSFGINGGTFELVDSVADLANAVATNPGGLYALASSYDAEKDGTYNASPVSSEFTGYFEALGNTISRLKINEPAPLLAGLFVVVNGDSGFGVVRNLSMENVSVEGGSDSTLGAITGNLVNGSILGSSVTGKVIGGAATGGLAGFASGTIESSWSSARVSGASLVGGLVGLSATRISNSYATGRVTGGAFAGGLVGRSNGVILGSFATGEVQTGGGDRGSAGGLVGAEEGIVENCYAMGKVRDTGGGGSDIGGLVGSGSSLIMTGGPVSSYSTGAPEGVESDDIGGSVGADYTSSGFRSVYWNTSTSHIAQGAGNITNDPGITGLTTNQLRSGLPDGFWASIWAQQAGINRGFPYLIANPPPK